MMDAIYRNFYFPDREEYDSPDMAGLAYEHVFFDSVDGTRLSGWFIPAVGASSPREATGTVIHLHGNAQNMAAHWRFAEFVPHRGYNLFTFDYRGYGDSAPIFPDPQSILADSVAALDYLRSRSDIDADRLFVFGQSLGGMLAIAASGASPQGVRAVVAEAPFYSYTMQAEDKMPGMGLRLDDACTAGAFVARLSPIPLMLIHGTADVIVRYKHSLKLYEEAREPKHLITIDGGAHIDAMDFRAHGTRYQDMMMRFFDDALQRPG